MKLDRSKKRKMETNYCTLIKRPLMKVEASFSLLSPRLMRTKDQTPAGEAEKDRGGNENMVQSKSVLLASQ